MKYAYYGFGMLLFGSIGLVLIVMLQSITINNDSEYYNLKEAMKAAMIESVDMTCYRIDQRVRRTSQNGLNDMCGSGKLKMSETKFVENFTRRFVATVGGDAKNYTIKFYDIIESPPKASVVIEGITDDYGVVSDYQSLKITNSLTGILEQNKILKLRSNSFEIVEDSKDVVAEDDLILDNSSEGGSASSEEILEFNNISTDVQKIVEEEDDEYDSDDEECNGDDCR